jgi:GR25 family glycosyltransferase involved in LPS biosynthesis
MPQRTVNDLFDRVVVLNLDRRPDRMAGVAVQLRRLGIEFERFPAVDGQDPATAAEWQAYVDRPSAELPPDARPVTSWREFYLDYESDLARGAFFEAERGRRAIATPGAFGLLRSMTGIVERALAEGWRSLLMLEDDVLFHKDTRVLFDRCVTQLPADWQILQLGAMQLHWENDWISWHSENLYRCRGSSIGAHAFALCADVLPALLERCRVPDLPFDIGALHTLKRRFSDQCFTMFPNLAIQDATDSEIGMSTLFFREARKVDNIYRWHLPDYGLAAIEAQRPVRLEGAFAGHPGPTVETRPAMRSESEPGGGMLQRLKRYASARPWRQAAATEPSFAGRPAATKPAPQRRLGGQPPLRARSNQRPRSRAVIAVVVGLEPDALSRVLDLLSASSTRQDVEPVLLTDCDAFELFRDRGLVFEYLPGPAQRQRFAADLDWDLYLLRRLALIRRKWQPVRIITFGAAAGQLLCSWKGSPFEDESIHQVAGGPAATVEMT